MEFPNFILFDRDIYEEYFNDWMNGEGRYIRSGHYYDGEWRNSKRNRAAY